MNVCFDQQESMPPILRGEILLDRMGAQARVSYEQLKKDAQELEIQIKQLQVSNIVTVVGIQRLILKTCKIYFRIFFSLYLNEI